MHNTSNCELTSFERLNRDCFCLSLDPAALAAALDAELGSPSLSQLVRDRCPYLFAAQPVFVARPPLERMARVVQAIEAVVALPAYREQVLADAPAIARDGTGGSQGVFFGYDFHLDQDRLGLIEINTNAGGAMLNAVLARAQRSCCQAVHAMVPGRAGVTTFEQRLVDMFRREWRLAGHSRPLVSIAIVDEAPQQQYLYPEFLLFRQLFERHGLQAIIVDPSELACRHGRLWHGELAIDVVYNRVTDFYLDLPANAVLRQAWLEQVAVLTPHPTAHALYADKRRLALFSDDGALRELGVADDDRKVLLANVPRTEVVDEAHGDRLWAARRSLFFKPAAGFGSRAAYRGDKLTRRVWQEIMTGAYVAQALVPPGERVIANTEGLQSMKFDLRAYAYAGDVQWVAARVYQGQTTNFRQPGSGFAPVYTTVDGSGRGMCDSDGEHASYVFLLDEAGEVHALPHVLYVALARGQALAPIFADQTLRLADWYVRLRADGVPGAVVNETYGFVRFDREGRFKLEAAPGDAAWPTPEERRRMQELLFSIDLEPNGA
ncbi:hypothetical protein [Diaphorobacter sp. ED-3]|uniref:hypothetical protein n=1 Tax=Diaphorobacter sp. ED-3 TaxID=3016636 RepID=UPI0005A04408|nr:hypothetical protein [Diaphorobacter sp. ED-3]